MLELIVEDGESRGARYPLAQGSIVMGRDVSCDVSIFDERASRKHARIEVGADGSASIVELGSRNGTLLNGLPLAPSAAAPLRVGDRIEIGSTRLVLGPGEGILGSAPPGLAGRTTIVARRPLRNALEATTAEPARVLELVAGIGYLLAGGGDPLRGALERALEVAGGARAGIFATGELAALSLLAATSDRVPIVPAEVRAALVDAEPECLVLEGSEGSALALGLPGRPGKNGLLVVENGPTRPGASLEVWAAVAGALAPHVAAAQELRALRVEAEEARRALARSVEIVAESPPMRRLLESAAKVAAVDAPVLVLGESGSGKELIARAIHSGSPRARQRFVAVNAAAFSETLLESELFGHERGAFTGAVARRKGVFELAHRGTLFLDEIGELALATQPKLLRALETGEVRPLGGSDAVRTEVRIVAATNRDLRQLVRDGRFREDLYFRLAAVELKVPALRERAQDLEPLVRHLLRRLTRGRATPVEPAALERLRAHHFPGNVRELKNVLERALLLGDGRTVRGGDLPPELGAVTTKPGASFSTLAHAERIHIERALRHTGWNRSQAAKLLGVDRKTLYLKVKALGLDPGLPPRGSEEEDA